MIGFQSGTGGEDVSTFSQVPDSDWMRAHGTPARHWMHVGEFMRAQLRATERKEPAPGWGMFAWCGPVEAAEGYFGLSRQTINRAVKALAAVGILVQAPGHKHHRAAVVFTREPGSRLDVEKERIEERLWRQSQRSTVGVDGDPGLFGQRSDLDSQRSDLSGQRSDLSAVSLSSGIHSDTDTRRAPSAPADEGRGQPAARALAPHVAKPPRGAALAAPPPSTAEGLDGGASPRRRPRFADALAEIKARSEESRKPNLH